MSEGRSSRLGSRCRAPVVVRPEVTGGGAVGRLCTGEGAQPTVEPMSSQPCMDGRRARNKRNKINESLFSVTSGSGG